MRPETEVVCDASVVLKWFHAEGEEEVGESRALLDLRRSGSVELLVLDLTAYEVGNALIRGVGVSAAQAQPVLEAIDVVSTRVAPSLAELSAALGLAEDFGLTVYDAAYAAVARSRNARLCTLDRRLLASGLGIRPSEIAV